MVRKIITDTLRHQLRRRDFLKGASALGAASAFPAIITRSALRRQIPQRLRQMLVPPKEAPGLVCFVRCGAPQALTARLT